MSQDGVDVAQASRRDLSDATCVMCEAHLRKESPVIDLLPITFLILVSLDRKGHAQHGRRLKTFSLPPEPVKTCWSAAAYQATETSASPSKKNFPATCPHLIALSFPWNRPPSYPERLLCDRDADATDKAVNGRRNTATRMSRSLSRHHHSGQGP